MVIKSTPRVTFSRLGIVLGPDAEAHAYEGTINPASARTRDGALVLLPRAVARGNISRIARCSSTWQGDAVAFSREGFALEPETPFEHRSSGGYGCEDPRVTFLPALDRYLMAYCAYGPSGARIAVATSLDALEWTRLGVVNFHGGDGFGDKDAAFFPEIVESPDGVPSFALLHRPSLHAGVADGSGIVPSVLSLPPSERESIHVSYVPAALVSLDLRALLDVTEDAVVMQPDGAWGAVKVGAGTPPVRTSAGWMFLYHGIDMQPDQHRAHRPAMRYRAGIAFLDLARPHELTYRSPEPVFWPEVPEELEGVVGDVVFPTAIDPRPEIGPSAYDIYYGMADSMIGRGRLTVEV